MPAFDKNSTDDLKDHITESLPRDNEKDVPLGATISVVFDNEVETLDMSKLFEVSSILLFIESWLYRGLFWT